MIFEGIVEIITVTETLRNFPHLGRITEQFYTQFFIQEKKK